MVVQRFDAADVADAAFRRFEFEPVAGSLTLRTYRARPVADIRNPQKSLAQRAAYLYWAGGWGALWPRVRSRLGAVTRRRR